MNVEWFSDKATISNTLKKRNLSFTKIYDVMWLVT